MPDYNQITFVTWYPYGRRAIEFSRFLKSHTLFTRHLIHSRGWRWKLFFWLDYLYKAVQTFVFLSINKPSMVIATSPPSLCVLVCTAWCLITRTPFLIDAHNSAFVLPWISIPFYKKTLQKAQGVIVHNDEYEKFLKQRYPNIRFFVLHDRIPNFSLIKKEPLGDAIDYILVVLSYNNDEPVFEILEAIKNHIRKSDKRLIFKLTGNCAKRPDLVDTYRDISEIRFVGFVSHDAYEKLMVNAYGILAITKMPMVQQSAIMEAVGACVPVISNDSETNKRILFQGAVLAKPESRSIENALDVFIKSHSALSEEIRSLRTYWENKWEEDFERLRASTCLLDYFVRSNE